LCSTEHNSNTSTVAARGKIHIGAGNDFAAASREIFKKMGQFMLSLGHVFA